VSWFGEPTLRYSYDGGKTWRTDGPNIGPDAIMQVILPDATVIFSAHAVTLPGQCESCGGSGQSTKYRYVKDEVPE